MSHLKLLGLAAVAAMALMAFAASSASATALYNGATKLGVGAELDFSLKTGTKSLLSETSTEGGGMLDECSTATIKAKITNAGGASATVSADITSLGWRFESCTFTTGPTVTGGLEFHQIGTSTEGTVTANAEISWSFETVFFGWCTYGAEAGLDIGKLTTFKSSTAEFHANAVFKRLTGSLACPATASWKATFVSTSPDILRIEAS